MITSLYQPYVIPGVQFIQPYQFYGYYPQYSIRTYPWYNNEWNYSGTGELSHEYNWGAITSFDNIELRPWPKVSIPKISVPTIPKVICGGYTGYQTNKFDLKKEIEKGNWVVAWADDIAEKDVVNGVVAGGVSVFSSNPGPFLLWIENLVNRTISSLSSSVQKNFTSAIQRDINRLAADVIKQAIQGKNANQVIKQFDTFDFKAGAIKYSGKNKVCGATVSNTWGMKPYLAFRIR